MGRILEIEINDTVFKFFSVAAEKNNCSVEEAIKRFLEEEVDYSQRFVEQFYDFLKDKTNPLTVTTPGEEDD